MDHHLIMLVHRPTPEAEDYKALRYTLEEKGVGTRFKIVAITSPVVGDGKTTTAINVAGALANRRGTRVLLIDADLRRPAVAAQLGLATADRPGIVDAITDPAVTLDDVIVPLPESGLHVLVPRVAVDETFELLRAPRLQALLAEARSRYDVIVVDTSPLLLVADARLLQGSVDAVVLVVAAHRTPRKLAAQAIELLDETKLLGVVFNRNARPLGGYDRYYGYGSCTTAASGPRGGSR